MTDLHVDYREMFFTLGVHRKYSLYIITDTGEALLDFYQDESTGEFKNMVFSYDRICADAGGLGYRLSALFSAHSLQQIGLDQLFDLIKDRFALGPGLQYISLLSSLRPGINFQYALGERLKLSG